MDREIDTEMDTIVDTGTGVGARVGHGILSSRAHDLRRYVHDRGRLPVRALSALVGPARRA
jgi:hypothetical protein